MTQSTYDRTFDLADTGRPPGEDATMWDYGGVAELVVGEAQLVNATAVWRGATAWPSLRRWLGAGDTLGADLLNTTDYRHNAMAGCVNVAARRAAKRMESVAGLDTSLGRTTASDILAMLTITLIIGFALWMVTYPMESGANRCSSCPVGVPVWMLNESDYVPIPDQVTTASIVGVVIGLLFPLRRRYADGPVMFGMRTRYRRHYSFSGATPVARIQNGMATSTMGRLVIFTLMLVVLALSSVSAYATGATHTTGNSYGSMKRMGKKAHYTSPRWALAKESTALVACL